MNWLVISLIPPMVWAFTNHLDKIILNKYFGGRNGGPYMILVSISISVGAFFIALFAFSQLFLNPFNIFVLILLGLLSMSGGLFYLFALSKGNPSVVVPLFQIVPIFNYFLGLIFLHETLTGMQIFGSLFIIGGALLLTVEQEEKKFKFNVAIIFWMLVSCLAHSIFDLVFKVVVPKQDFWGSTFWVYIGCILFGIILFIASSKWRKETIDVLNQYKAKVVGVNLINDGLGLSASLIFNYVLLMVPIALVSVIGNGLQPFFVLLFGIILTLISPALAHETLNRRHLTQKIVAIAIIFFGTFLLNR